MMINKIYPDKVIVFWDGQFSKDYRRTFYPEYKLQREGSNVVFDKEHQFNIQKTKSQFYCEELYLRQFEDENSVAKRKRDLSMKNRMMDVSVAVKAGEVVGFKAVPEGTNI
jgi:5'-3' exonuclease